MSNYFSFEVNTAPMAESVDTISRHVNGTTAAVVAMEAAVIETEKASADFICENVDRGFFNLIKSQNSTKLAESFTKMNASIAHLSGLGKRLAQQQMRMEGDYARLKTEYGKIFKGLDKSLENRVRELDRDTMNLADIRERLIVKHQNGIAETKCSSTELGYTEQMAVSARIKSKTSKTIGVLGGNLAETRKYTANLDALLDKKQITDDTEMLIPVIVAHEESNVNKDAYLTKIYCQEKMDNSSKNAIQVAVMNSGKETPDISEAEDAKAKIKEEFNKYVIQSGLDDRTKQVICQLFEKGGH